MEIEKLRRLWHLSTVPTHSPESMKELHGLVREAIIHLLSEENFAPNLSDICLYCRNEPCYVAGVCAFQGERYDQFELKMEGD